MALLYGLLVGLALGLTGGGGSILAVPLLIYGLGLEPKAAIALSLVVVAATALMGAVSAFHYRLVELRAALIFALGGIVAAPAGVRLGDYLTDQLLLAGFAILMLAVAARMLFSAARHPDQASVVRGGFQQGSADDWGTVCRYSHDGRLRFTAPCGLVLAIAGLVTGLLSGLFGVGGGFIIVPALMLVTAMGIHRAVATSLLVIALVGTSGAVFALSGERELDWLLALPFLLGGLLGMGLGRGLAGRLPAARLQQIFAIVMIAVALYMIIRQWALLPTGVGA